MGVPSFFAWLLRSKIVTLTRSMPKVDYLYIDANSLFHPVCQRCESMKKSKMRRDIIAYLEKVICLVNPKKVSICVDGVAPLSKIKQQRIRRAKKVRDEQLTNEIKKKHGKEVTKKWNSTHITPGTQFMKRLHETLQTYADEKNYDYSSYLIPGEGEHKILDKIRNSKEKGVSRMIYGLDADLIFLAAIVSTKVDEEIYLLRDNDDGTDHNIVNIPELISSTVSLIEKRYFALNEENKNQFHFPEKLKPHIFDDFIFIMLFVGNDFIPQPLALDIKNGAIDSLIRAYVIIVRETGDGFVKINMKKRYIEFNNKNILTLIERQSRREAKYCNGNYQSFINSVRKKAEEKAENITDEYEKEVFCFENMIGDYKAKILTNFNDTTKHEYYRSNFGFSFHYQIGVNDSCSQFIAGLNWCMRYYYFGCPSWDWYYAYDHSPFIVDIYHYFKNKNINVGKQYFKQGKPISIETQLVTVVPAAHKKLISKKYRKLITDKNSDIIDMFPTKFQINTSNKYLYWKCEPRLPPLDIERIEAAVYKCHLSKF